MSDQINSFVDRQFWLSLVGASLLGGLITGYAGTLYRSC